MATPRVHATLDPSLTAVLGELRPLVYATDLSEHDVPAHVRAASALRRSAGRLVIVQDDVNVLVLERDGAEAEAVLLPAGAGGLRSFDGRRGNKHAKMDLEACAALPDGRLVAFGSGSTHARERLVVFGRDAAVRIVDGSDLYALFRTEASFAGSELNIEGALVVGDALRLFQRGNGARVRGIAPVNATLDLQLGEFNDWLTHGSALPAPSNIVQYDLGLAGDVAFTFTDAALMADGRVAFLACAEASPDTYHDGEVLGVRFGISDGVNARLGPIVNPDGSPARLKLEGIERRPGAERSFDVVADMDRPDEPALWGQLELTGAFG